MIVYGLLVVFPVLKVDYASKIGAPKFTLPVAKA
jgi:hypothetical protein